VRILVDENIPLMAIEQLRLSGHNIADVRGTLKEGSPDEFLFKKACDESRLLITTDRGFASYRNREHYGILIVALRRPNRQNITTHIVDAIKQFPADQWRGLLVVMRDRAMSTWSQTSK
jgi:predicted nuclease of predicted toxin-antitoxin system